MMDRRLLYDIIYALAATGGREQLLFGKSGARARKAFARSLVGPGFPELWFEVPLAGEPWFDFHALADHSELHGADPELLKADVWPEVFAWFAACERGVRQLALSWDVGKGEVETPTIQLLIHIDDPQPTCEFLEQVGRADAVAAYRAFRERIPEKWFACYTGVFPGRTEPYLRVECVPSEDLQQAYAREDGLLEEHLRQVGLAPLGDTLVERCRYLADQPFRLEFQFDVGERGCPTDTFAASLRFAQPPGTEDWHAFSAQGEAAALMRQVEAWGLADSRWQALAETSISKRLARGDEAVGLYCFPAFLKLRWRAGEALDAKAYLMAGAILGE